MRALSLDEASAGRVAPGLQRIRLELEVPVAYAPEALEEAERAAADLVLPEEDATDLPMVTIDPPGAKDLDQAMHLEREGEQLVLRYAIADPASFVEPGGALDAEVHARGMTFYGPDGRIGLHPPVLAEDAASLLPDVVRPACLWTIRLDSSGEIADVGVRRARVRSTAQLTYTEVQRDLDAGTASQTLRLLRELGQLRQRREVERGGASLEIPEQEVERTPDGYRLQHRTTLPVEDWNAQVSLTTGIAAATLMRRARVGVLRTLPEADPRDVARLRRTAHALGIDWPRRQRYGELLRRLDAGRPAHAAFLDEATLLFRGAGYLTFDGDLPPASPHGAIAAEYAHVTAPLRRLVDRYGLEICLAETAGTPVPGWVRDALPDLPATMSRASQRTGAYERACVDLVEALVLEHRVGETFTGVVVDVGTRRATGNGNGRPTGTGRATAETTGGAKGDATGDQRGDTSRASAARADGPVPEGEGDDVERGTVVVAEPAVRARVTGRALPLGESVRTRLELADPETRRVEFAIADPVA